MSSPVKVDSSTCTYIRTGFFASHVLSLDGSFRSGQVNPKEQSKKGDFMIPTESTGTQKVFIHSKGYVENNGNCCGPPCTT